ncbi:MAG TPA: TetR family transcriptional regulator [Solirubrobacteraceae bacterium]|nr:TetR family transcriptional regulator [Solirubrobacteraceae bacterium]
MSRRGADVAPTATRVRTPYAVAARRLLRDTLFDATRDELRLRSWADITMADIARLGGVSRQTLYKEFGSRDEFAQAFVIREGERFLEAVEHAVREHFRDPSTALTAAFDVFLTTAAEDPFVRLLLSDDGTAGMLPLVTTQGKPVVEWASERLTNIIRSGWPQSQLDDVQLLAECLVRLAISYVTLPKGSTSTTAAAVLKLLGPYIERAIVSV